jgi:glycosyltransferase involved in cell wall biosynthesis
VDRFRPVEGARERVRARYGISDGALLLYVGRVSRDKGLDTLLEAYGELLGAHPSLSLMIVGDGPHLESLKASAPAQGEIVFTGRLPHEQLPELYSAADLFVFPSATDTYGLVVLEAQACGLPAIVSDVGGPQEIIVAGETGWTAPGSDPAAWCETIAAALLLRAREPEAWEKISRAARERVVAHNAWDTVLADLFAPALPSGPSKGRETPLPPVWQLLPELEAVGDS